MILSLQGADFAQPFTGFRDMAMTDMSDFTLGWSSAYNNLSHNLALVESRYILFHSWSTDLFTLRWSLSALPMSDFVDIY